MEYEPKQPVYLPILDFLNLEFHLMDTRPDMKPDAFVTELVKRWLATEMERLALRKNGMAMRGFQWRLSSYLTAPACEPAMATPPNSLRSLAITSFPTMVHR
jgi:hypothetical protein